MSEHDRLRELVRAAYDCRGAGAQVLNLAEFWPLIEAAESTLPKTKMVEVWRVECATRQGQPIVWAYLVKADADKQASGVEGATDFRCIRVTGPHQQEVPAT